MNKFLTKIIGATLAFAMMIGGAVGINASKQAKEVSADPGDTVAFMYTTSSSKKLSTSYGVNSLADDGAKLNVSCTTAKTKGSGAIQNTYNTTFGGQQMTTNANRDTTVTFTFGNPWSGAHATYKDYTQINSVTFTAVAGSSTSYNVSCTVDSVAATGDHTGFDATKTTITFTPAEEHNHGVIVITVSFNSGSKGWYFDNLGINAQVPANAVSYPVVSFESNGGSSVDSQQINDPNANYAVRPTNPTKRGFTFVDWYTDEELQNPYTFGTEVTESFTLYAKWEKANATSIYSPSIANGDYRLAGEVTAITGSTEFFIQSGNNAMHVGGGDYTASLQNGNSVDLFGTYNGTILSNLAYCDKTSQDTNIEQTYLSSLNDVTEANLCKYFRIDNIQLGSGFDANSKKASIKDSELIIYFNAKSKVNNNSFEPNDYSANDYVSAQGVIFRHNSTSELGLYITHIEKPTQFVVTFDYNDGRGTYTTQTVLNNACAQAPANPTKESDNLYDYAFAGWYANPQCSGSTYNFNTPVTESFPLYARWNATEKPAFEVVKDINTKASLTYRYSKEGNGQIDTLTRDTTGITDSSYDNWENEDYSSGVFYKGRSAGSNSSIQLRVKESSEGVVSYSNANNFDVKKVTVQFESHTTDGNSVQIYGKNTAYSSASELFNDQTQGTLLGTIVCGAQTNSITVQESFKYIGIKSTSGAVYLSSVAIQWGDLPTYNYSNVGVRFTGFVSATLWNRLNSESTIQGYGFMYATAEYLSGLTIEGLYGLARDGESSVDDTFTNVQDKTYKMVKDTEIKSFYTPLANSEDHPVQVGDNYGWSLFKNISDAELGTPFTAVAYIRTASNEIVFLNEITKSAAQLAQDLIDAENEYDATSLEGSLADLASKA